MRGYFLCNYYLSSIQQGIQAAHCVADMFVRYSEFQGRQETEMLYTWARDHKTMVLLNGGNHDNLISNYHTISRLCTSLGYPFAAFDEDEVSLNNATTCVGLIVEPHIYQTKVYVNEYTNKLTCAPKSDPDAGSALSGVELELAYLLQSMSLAR